MPGDRLLLDTAFVQALLNRKDKHHRRATELLPRITMRSPTSTWPRARPAVFVDYLIVIECDGVFSAPGNSGTLIVTSEGLRPVAIM